MTLNNLNISRKLALGFAVVVSIVLAMCAVVFVGLSAIMTTTDGSNQSHAALSAANAALAAAVEEQNAVRGFVASGDPSFIDKYKGHKAAFAAAVDQLASVRSDAASQANVAALKTEIAIVNGQEDGQIAQRQDPAQVAQDQASIMTTGRLTKIRDIMKGVTNAENARLEANARAQASAIRTANLALAFGVAVATLLAIAVGVLLTRAIAGPVSAMTTAMGRLASGDNTVAIPAVGRRDEVGRMAGAVQTFKEAALEKLRLEGEAAGQRAAAEQARRSAESERAGLAQEQADVVGALAQGLERLSAGALAHRLTTPFAPAYETLRADFNAAMDKLQETMKVVAHNTVAIRTGTDEISQASDDLSRRTEQQAASLEETAAALDEITATVRKTAQGAAHAREAVGAARGDAEQSGIVVRQAVEAMSGIESSAQQISQIIGVIDEIAFQTNLLALNAGVEAARAGDAGRGFAVVASEVRALAQRSAEAAKEIKALISASTKQVDAGVDLVGQTGKALERIVAQVAQLNTLVGDIAASTQEQATGLQQVNIAINQMDQVTQQNAAMVEQSTAASHALAQEAMTLARLIAVFDLGDKAAPGRATRAA